MKPVLLVIIFMSFLSCNTGVGNSSGATAVLKRPDIDVKILLDRPTYSVEYLSNWKIDSSSKTYDIDGHFTLQSSFERGLITFFIFNVPKDETETLKDHVNAQLAESIKDGSVSYFNKWGNYQGHGAIISGRVQGAWKGELMIFVHSTKSKSFLIISIYADGYKNEVLPGLTQIESSFRLK